MNVTITFAIRVYSLQQKKKTLVFDKPKLCCICTRMWHSLLNDMEIIETKRFTPKGSEQGTTLTLRFGLLALILEIPHQSFSYPMKITVESVSF